MQSDAPKPTGLMAAEVCRDVPLEKAARKLLRDDLTAEDFIWLLADAGHFNDATRVLARLLPPREAVWWACQCARQVPLPDAPPEVEAALLATEQWVTAMTEETRRTAGQAGEQAEIGTATGCAAMAAFATGSLTPPDVPQSLPPAGLTAQYVTASILVSALSPEPAEAPAKYRTFLQQGIDLYRTTTGQ